MKRAAGVMLAAMLPLAVDASLRGAMAKRRERKPKGLTKEGRKRRRVRQGARAARRANR